MVEGIQMTRFCTLPPGKRRDRVPRTFRVPFSFSPRFRYEVFAERVVDLDAWFLGVEGVRKLAGGLREPTSPILDCGFMNPRLILEGDPFS